MKIVNKGVLKILFPENGYELINKNTGMHCEKVYLSINDSMDNYIEIAKDDYMSGVQDLKDKVDEDTILLMNTLDGLITLLEPVITAMPMIVNEETNPLDIILMFYSKMIEKGLKNIDDVPNAFKTMIINKNL